MKYFAFLLSVRNRDVDYLFQMGRLFQEFVIFGRMIIDNSRLIDTDCMFIRFSIHNRFIPNTL